MSAEPGTASSQLPAAARFVPVEALVTTNWAPAGAAMASRAAPSWRAADRRIGAEILT
jgi:hypothetical protein